LLVTPEGNTKVIDLGLAWFLEADMPEAQELDRLKIVGTADYLAPETINEPDRVMPISDIYALGCTLYYAVTGKVPFPGGNPLEKMARHRSELPLSPQQFNSTLPAGFVAVIEQMMDKNHATRIHTAEAVAKALDPWVDADSAVQLSRAVEQSNQQRRQPRPAAKQAAPQPRLDETLIYGADEEAAIGPSRAVLPTSAVDGRIVTARIDNSPGESQVIEIEPEPPVDRLDQAVTFSIWAAALVMLALLAGILWDVLS
jgi:serine/threonine protein kinase